MEKSRVCINRTINLAKAKKKCRKSHLLVYQKKHRKKMKYERPLPATHIARISALPAKRIRVCTGAELRKLCPPIFCDCPPKTYTLSLFKVLCWTACTAVKAVIAGSFIYMTYDAGIWGPSDNVEQIYIKMCERYAPMLCPDSPKPIYSKECEANIELMCVPPPPHGPCCGSPPIDHQRAGYFLTSTWNYYVASFFEAITNFPDNFLKRFHKLKVLLVPPPKPPVNICEEGNQ